MTSPGEKLVLARYCGPSIDVGPKLTDKIMRKNGQQVHMYTHMTLKTDEFVNPDDIKAHDEFDTAIGEKLVPTASAKYFESNPEIFTPTPDRHEDDEENQTHMCEVDEITPEAIERYIGA